MEISFKFLSHNLKTFSQSFFSIKHVYQFIYIVTTKKLHQQKLSKQESLYLSLLQKGREAKM